MKSSLIMILTFVSFNLFSQELKMKTRTFYSGMTEKYYVLKSDKLVKQGEYKLIYKGDIMIEGLYNNNKRDSIWVFYNDSHDSMLLYNYTNNKILFWKCQNKWQSCRNNKSPAFYSNGFNIIQNNILENLKLPGDLPEEGPRGTAEISVIIDSNGKFFASFVKKSTGYFNLDQAANIAVNKSCQGDWIPAIEENGKAVKDTLTFTVIYKTQ